MGRLIDADELLSVVRHMTVVDKSVMHRILIQMPTVDAVEVVRCRDCKWRDDQKGATKWMPCRALVTPNDFYCASGERKDGDGNG